MVLSVGAAAAPRWRFNGGWTESKQISLGDIKVKCLTLRSGTGAADVTAPRCASVGPLKSNRTGV